MGDCHVNRSKVGSDSDEMLEIFISRMEVVRQFTRSGLVHGGEEMSIGLSWGRQSYFRNVTIYALL